MAITEETLETNQTELGLIHLPPGLQEGMNRRFEPGNEEQDSGSGTLTRDNSAQMMGKLCKQALVLIKHKVGTDVNVSDHMVWALEEWLQRQGITIYTERFL
jgi:hypothetical protein